MFVELSIVAQEGQRNGNVLKNKSVPFFPVSVPGWSGVGYIIADPQTGDGAYKIGGGANGGYLNVKSIFNSIFDVLLGLLKDAGNNLAGLVAKIKSLISHGLAFLDLLITCSFEDLFFPLPFYIWFVALGALVSVIAAVLITVLTVAFLGVIIGILIEGFIVSWAATSLVERCKSGRR